MIFILLYLFIGVNSLSFKRDSSRNQIKNGVELEPLSQSMKYSKDSVKNLFLDKASSLSIHLHQIAGIELGISLLQDEYDSLPYENVKKNAEYDLSKMVQSLEDKLKLYTSLVKELSSMVEKSYEIFKEEKLNKKRHQNIGFDSPYFFHQSRNYYNRPCCMINDDYFMYNPNYKSKINADFWCDSGLGKEDLANIDDIFFPPFKLTEVFEANYRLYPNIKWQFFMTQQGLHSEFPAHKPGRPGSTDCSIQHRHQAVYEKTIRPIGRNVVLLFDLDYRLKPRRLLTAKAIGRYVLETLTESDNIAMLGNAQAVVYPTPKCFGHSLMPATEPVKRSYQYFVDHLKIQEGPTNHSQSFESALDLISSWSNDVTNTSVLLVYVTETILRSESQLIGRTIQDKLFKINSRVFISVFGLGFQQEKSSYEVLEWITSQNFPKFGLEQIKSANKGELKWMEATLDVRPVIRQFYDVVSSPNRSTNALKREKITFDVHWDSDISETVLTLSEAVYDRDELIGVIGIDLSLSFFLEDAAYFYSSDHSYVFVIDSKGNALYHPEMGRPDTWESTTRETSVTKVDKNSRLKQVLPHILLLPSGHKKFKKTKYSDNSNSEFDYTWKRSKTFDWIFVLAEPLPLRNIKRLKSSSVALSSNAIFHRLDLLSPQQAKVCRHFKQMATLDGVSIYLSSAAFTSPGTYLSNNYRNVNTRIMEYLTDDVGSVPNPSLRAGIKEDVKGLYKISEHWEKLFKESNLQKYIVRKYGATSTGVAVMYPGTLLDASTDPMSQDWFINALNNRNKVVVSAPFLDPAGAGYIVTISQAVFEGRSKVGSKWDPVQCVLAADFTLGYWLKTLVDIEPLCANNIYFNDLNKTDENSIGVRCFLMDSSGYLISHSSFVDPILLTKMRKSKSNFPPHITHKEPVLSMSLLAHMPRINGHKRPVLEKVWCENAWKGTSKRRYLFNLEPGHVIQSNSVNKGIDEQPCFQYKLSAVPSTNLIFGFVNQTCSPTTAFCPCSLVDRLCLNCQIMEKSACECPCECPILSNTCQTVSSMSMTSNDDLHQGQALPACPRSASPPTSLQSSVGMLSQLDVCVPTDCMSLVTIHACLGVIDCVWCVFHSDAVTLMKTPYCTNEKHCHGGVKGGNSPYPPGLAPLPHSEGQNMLFSIPIGPVTGGVVAIFVVFGVAAYFFRIYAGAPNPRNYTPATIQSSQQHRSYLYTSSFYPEKEIETIQQDPAEEGVASTAAAATLSPYRMNPAYRRPCPQESSDNGYSTMTPHEDSENLFLSSSGSHDDRSNYSHHRWSIDESESPEISSNDFASTYASSFQTRLSSPKQIGPNRVIAPVTVHMVDTA